MPCHSSAPSSCDTERDRSTITAGLTSPAALPEMPAPFTLLPAVRLPTIATTLAHPAAAHPDVATTVPIPIARRPNVSYPRRRDNFHPGRRRRSLDDYHSRIAD